MKIEFTITNDTVELLSNTDTGSNILMINGVVIPESSWVGSGYYTYGSITIKKIADNTGNIYCNRLSATAYELNREVPVSGGGHVILDESGVSMPQRAKLQFENCEVTDDSANDKTIVTASEGMGFVLANRTLTFSNNIATVSDSRVTSNTYATLYFHDGCLAAAVSAGLTVDTSTGFITITAESTPSSSLTCDIVCENGTGGGSVSSLIAELRTDVDSLETLMGNTSISGIGDGSVTGAISTINTNLSDENWEQIFPIINTNTVASGAVLAYKNKHFCYVYLSYLTFRASGNGQLILSGLPKALAQYGGAFTGADYALSGAIMTSGDVLWIETNGTVVNAHISPYHLSDYHWAYLIYPIVD